jgi:hypothetical protein
MPGKTRNRVAIFLGAGASKSFGLPLTSEILPLIRQECQSGDLFNGAKPASTQTLERYLSDLLPGYKDLRLHLPLVTDILSLIDYSLLVSNNPIRRIGDLDLLNFRELLEQAIFALIQAQDPFRNSSDSLQLLAAWLVALSRKTSLSIITSNYDMSLDSQLAAQMLRDKTEMWEIPHQFDFGFAWRDPWSGSIQHRSTIARFPFYKLHGSVNWLRCQMCEHIYINVWGPIGEEGYDPVGPNSTMGDARLCHCDHGPLRPVIVAPSLVRDIRNANLLETWKHSLESLRGCC